MSTFYLDYVNGNDSNDGSTWALAWKTITLGATAARIAPGDVIRIAKSPDPTSLGQTAVWTNLSKTVTLTTAVTANITDGTVLTAGSGVVSTADATDYKDSVSNKLVTDGSVTGAQKLAYKTITSTDFSGYQQISFWLKNSTVALTTGLITIKLCSDTTGDTAVNTFSIPAIPSSNTWIPLTIDNDAALGSSIQSIAIYCTGSFSSRTIYFDNFLACKNDASADSLTLNSLISKNTLAQGGTEGWFALQSIDGTTLKIDNYNSTLGNAGRGYSGTSETVTIYKRETIKTDLASISSTAVQTIQDSGTSASYIEFQGGYNTSTSLQDGETFFDGRNGYGYGIYAVSKAYNRLNYINCYRYVYGFSFSAVTYFTFTNASACHCAYGFINQSNSSYLTFDNIANCNNNLNYNIYLSGSFNSIFTAIGNINGCIGGGMYLISSGNYSFATISNMNNNGTYGIYLSNSAMNTFNEITNCNNNASYGLYFSSSSENIIRRITTSGNISAVLNIASGRNFFYNSTFGETTEVNSNTAYSNSAIHSQDHDDISDNNWIFMYGGTINSQTAVRYAASGIAWKMSPTNTARSSTFPLVLSIAKVACINDKLVTISCWMRRSNTGLTGSLVCRGGQIDGVASNVTSSMTAVADTWEQVSISFTPTESGVVEVEAWAYGGTTYSLYLDSMVITQAD